MQPADIFDMDRTLVRVNSSHKWAQFQRRRGNTRPGDLARTSWMLLQYMFGVLDMEALAHRAAATQVGKSEQEFRDLVRGWVRAEVLPHVADEARRAVAKAKSLGRPCAILTTSSNYVAEPVAEELGIEHVLSSRVEVKGGRFTGRLISLCYGAHKIGVAEQWAKEHGVDLARSSFYSDSISDVPMLERVGEPYVVNPDPRLRWVARQRGWPVLKW